MRRGSSLASLLTLALGWASVAAAPATLEDEHASALEQRKAAAKAEVQAARAAFEAGEYRAAVDHYAAALALVPAPKLHFNIAVCHQRLALEAESPEQRTRERELAIESYNRYLEDNPDAGDRREVAETVRELGGTPVTMPALKRLFDDADDADDEIVEVDEPPVELDGATASSPRARPYPHHGRFGVMLAGGYSPTMTAARSIDAASMLALDLHAGGFLGRRRRFLLAAHTLLYSGRGRRGSDGLAFYGYSMGLLGQQTWVLGREAIQLSLGGVVALTGQGLSARDNVAPGLCSVENGLQAASRTGAWLAPRFDLGVLVGARRRGMIGLLVQPGFAVVGDGPRGALCSAGETPWTAVGVRRRWQLQLWAGAGFGLRF